MVTRLRTRWTLACWLGYLALFLGFLLTGQVMDLFRPASWPDASRMGPVDPVAPPDWLDPDLFRRMYWTNLLYHLLHLALFGTLIGWLQARVLTGTEPEGEMREEGGSATASGWPIERLPWSLLAAAGFASILVLEAVRPGVVAGGHPAPLEPILIALGGGGLAGLYQWLYARRRGLAVTRWLGFWVGGLVTGVAAAALVLTAAGPLTEPVARALFQDDRVLWLSGQVVFFSLYGSVVGAVAGWISGRAIEGIAVPGIPVGVDRP